MTVLAIRHGGNREARMFNNIGLSAPAPGSYEATALMAGYDVNALAVAAVASAVKLVTETVASFVMRVYEGDAMEREVVLDDPVAELFQYPRLDGQSDSFTFWQDVSTACEVGEGCAILKRRDRRRKVAELEPLAPGAVKVSRDGGRRRVEAHLEGDPPGRYRDVTGDVVWVRGWSPCADPTGISTLRLNAPGLRTAWAYEVWRSAYFENGAQPSVVLQHPGNPNKEIRTEILDGWTSRNAGARNQGKVALVWGGMTATSISPTLRDSQTAEIADTIVRDVARMFRIVPAELLATTIASSTLPSPEHAADLFVRFTALPRLRRIERALAVDPDLFPDRARYPRFDLADFLRGDLATRATVVHMLRQDGVITANEGRAEFGYEPRDDGDELQVTPVGGAPNTGEQTPAESPNGVPPEGAEIPTP